MGDPLFLGANVPIRVESQYRNITIEKLNSYQYLLNRVAIVKGR